MMGKALNRLARITSAPLRWWTRRHRRTLALSVLRQLKYVYGTKARLTLWDGRLRGGVGVIELERGRVQIHIDDEGYLVQWFGESGSNQHPVRHDEIRTTDDVTFETTVRKWSERGHVNERRPSGIQSLTEY